MLSCEEALTRAAGQLSAHPELRPTALADAVHLLLALLGVERVSLIAHPERLLTLDEQAGYQRLLERRLRFEPIQYILGTAEFFGMTLQVSPAVLIPRPETELLVEAAAARLPAHTPVRLLDVGTGSGAIALALRSLLPLAEVTAVDLSDEALTVAAGNVRRHGFAGSIRLLRSNLLASLMDEVLFDAIVANLPYVPEADRAGLHTEVLAYEPASALFAGDDGLDLYRRLVPEAAEKLTPGGLLAMEIGFGQREALRALLTGGAWERIEFLEDLQGIPRVCLARRRAVDGY